jgi:hypothetical protein
MQPIAKTTVAKNRIHAPGGVICDAIRPNPDEHVTHTVLDLFGRRVPNRHHEGVSVSLGTVQGIAVEIPRHAHKATEDRSGHRNDSPVERRDTTVLREP